MPLSYVFFSFFRLFDEKTVVLQMQNISNKIKWDQFS